MSIATLTCESSGILIKAASLSLNFSDYTISRKLGRLIVNLSFNNEITQCRRRKIDTKIECGVMEGLIVSFPVEDLPLCLVLL